MKNIFVIGLYGNYRTNDITNIIIKGTGNYIWFWLPESVVKVGRF